MNLSQRSRRLRNGIFFSTMVIFNPFVDSEYYWMSVNPKYFLILLLSIVFHVLFARIVQRLLSKCEVEPVDFEVLRSVAGFFRESILRD